VTFFVAITLINANETDAQGQDNRGGDLPAWVFPEPDLSGLAQKTQATIAALAAAELARQQAEQEAARLASQPTSSSTVSYSPSQSPSYGGSGGGGDAGDMSYIYEHESSNNPCAYYPSMSDCGYTGEAACGLGGALPCSKMRDSCGMSDYACQDRWFRNYAIERYKSISAAVSFHMNNGWW